MNVYVLMNRDEPILDFVCRRDEFDDSEFFELNWHSCLRPIGSRGITAFLEDRRAPLQRENMASLLVQYRCDDLETFLQVTHALSLNDTFWVRRKGEDLEWKDVSLYANEFTDSVCKAAFTGSVFPAEPSPTSPEFCTGGQFAKCWIREPDGISLYKGGSDIYEIDPFSEYLASQLSSEICPSAVPYELGFYLGKLISKCPLFTNESVGFVSARELFGRRKRTIPQILDFFQGIGGGDAFRRMFVLDAVILNPDRHYGNFGALFDTSTMDLLGMAPVYDNNRALFPELDLDRLQSPDWYIARCKPRYGEDFLLTARELMTEDIRRDLRRLTDFQFRQSPVLPVAEERSEVLSELVQSRIRELLSD